MKKRLNSKNIDSNPVVRPPKTATPQHEGALFPIVGIGASAGGLEAYSLAIEALGWSSPR